MTAKTGALKTAKRVIAIEREALAGVASRLGSSFERACGLLSKCKGRVVVTGMGKPGFIAQKISATLSSTGTPSLFLHPAEALHGDLGRVMKEDVVLAFSNSGETEEIVKLLPVIRKIGAKIVAFTGNAKSALARHSDIWIDVAVKKEACSLNLAPTASTTAMLAVGDALAVALLEIKGFKAEHFAMYHPGGNLGKKLLLKVSDIMRSGRSSAVVPATMKLRNVLYRITAARAGSASVVDARGRLKGIFTDGDLRRHLKEGSRVLDRKVSEVMTAGPFVIGPTRLAAEALEIMRSRKIDELPVVDAKGKAVGLLDVQDLLRAGIV